MIIPHLFRRAKTLAEYPTTSKKLFKIAAELPVDRYYISDDAALRYVRGRYYKGHKKKFSSIYKKRLFESLYDQVCEMMKEKKYRDQGLATTTILALLRPAPCIGVTPYYMYMAYKGHKGQKQNKVEDE